MVLRWFCSAVAPDDLDELIRLFEEDVVPVFGAHEECLGIELIVAEEPGPAGLIEGGALTRWKSVEGMEKAVASEELLRSQHRVRELLRREPIRVVYRVVG